MAMPTREGELGETVFDGTTTWLCLGGTQWVMDLPLESDALVRQRGINDLDDNGPL